jgi:hypothetical protein
MRQLRPVPQEIREGGNGTLHIIGMRDYEGVTEKTLCGYTHSAFDAPDGDIEEYLDSPNMCGRCKKIYQAQ